MDRTTLIMMLIPVIALQFGLQIAALINLVRRRKVRFNSKILWAVIIIIGEILGPIIYFIGRGDEE